MSKMKYALLALGLLGCAAEDLTPPPGDEPVAGSVAVSTAALTQTVTITSVFNHFTLNGVPNGVTYSTMVVNGTVYYKPMLWRPIYWRVGDTATFPVEFGWYQGFNSAELQVCKQLSGHKLYAKSNGTYVQGLNLEGKLVAR